MVYRGQIRNGKVEFDNGFALPEGAEVDVTLRGVAAEPQGVDDVPTLYEQLADIIGTVPDLPEDFSVNHDHYLYGTARRE